MREYKIERANDSLEWDIFVKSSKNGTIFSYSKYLEALKIRYGCYFILKNNEKRAALSVIESKNGTNAVLDDLVIYNGLIFGPGNKEQNEAQRNSEKYRITEFAATQLATIYKSVKISLHPSIYDLRPFLWYNYGKDLPKYKSNVRYTSYLDISDFSRKHDLDSILCYQSASTARRQEIRYGIRENVNTEELFSPDLFVFFYQMTMKKSGEEVSSNKLNRIVCLMEEIIYNKMGKMYIAKTQTGDIGSLAFFVNDQYRSYYLFGANNPDLHNKHTGTMVLWDAFYALREDGMTEIDLEGVNSPNRGWFKLSFGGSLVPYYELSYCPNK